MSIWSRRRGEEGFTLIELAVALGLFGLVLVSLSLLFDQALETTRQVQSDQIAKTLAQEKMEEVRSLPFYISQQTTPADVDLLDRYFPDDAAVNPTPTGAVGTYDGTAGVYSFTSTETITRAGVTFTRRTVVQLVSVSQDGTVTVLAPPSNYDSDSADFDDPGARAAMVTVSVTYTTVGDARQVDLETIISSSRSEEPKVEASASVTGAQISGVTFQDGDDPATGVAADLFAEVAQAKLAFREVTGSSAQASADPVEVAERDPDTNANIQPEAPGEPGEAAATAPNSTDGNQQTDSDSLSLGRLLSVNPSPTDPVVIASWGSSSPSATSEARVSFQHFNNPESRATVFANEFLLNARDLLAVAPHAVIEIGHSEGEVEQTSTTSQARATGRSLVQNVTIWGSTTFGSDPDYAGTVLIERIEVFVESVAGSSSASTRVVWRVDNLFVWDPDGDSDGDGDPGEYVGPWTFGFDSSCGGWVFDPALCGVNRTDGKAPFENPNPVVIPAAYEGTDPDGNASTSLVILAGATVRESAADASTGVSGAQAGQQNVLSIFTRNDITGAAALEPMLAGLGSANTSVAYVAHEH